MSRGTIERGMGYSLMLIAFAMLTFLTYPPVSRAAHFHTWEQWLLIGGLCVLFVSGLIFVLTSEE